MCLFLSTLKNLHKFFPDLYTHKLHFRQAGKTKIGHTRKIENSIKVHNKKTRNITIGHVIKSEKNHKKTQKDPNERDSAQKKNWKNHNCTL